jgi:Helix-turn-helix domain
MELLDTNEASAFLKTPAKTLVAWRCTKRVKVPFVKIGGNVRYRKSDLVEFIEANMHDTQEAGQ